MGPALQKHEEIAKVAKTMMRAFCVMVYEEKFNCADGSSKIDWKNYRVLVGKGDDVETCKKVIGELVGGEDNGFEIILREQKM